MHLDEDGDDQGSLRLSPVPSETGGFAGGPAESTPVRPAHRSAATPSGPASAKAASGRKRGRGQARDSESEEQSSINDGDSDLSDVEEDDEGERDQEGSADGEDSGAESDATAVPSKRGGKSNKRRKV